LGALDEIGRFDPIQGHLGEPGEDPAVPSDILWSLDVDPASQSFDVDHVGDYGIELKDIKHAARRRMCTRIVRNYLYGYISKSS
jgi:hypothetical protein